MKKSMEEYSDDDCLDGLGILMQEEVDKEAPVEEFWTDDPHICRYEELVPQYKVPEKLDPVWEATCQKQLDGGPQ